MSNQIKISRERNHEQRKNLYHRIWRHVIDKAGGPWGVIEKGSRMERVVSYLVAKESEGKRTKITNQLLSCFANVGITG